MNKLSILSAVAVLVICGSALGAVTLFEENFDYATGMLTDVSGGVWDTWLGTSQDAVVVSKMAVFDGVGTPEVVSYYPNALPVAQTMIASFDFFVHEEGTTDTDSYLMIGGGTEATSEIDYNIWGFIVDWGAEAPGSTKLHLWDMDGGNGGGDWGIPLLVDGLALDTWHSVELIAKQTVADPLANAATDADGQFQVWVNGSLEMDWTNFGNNTANGVNSVDIYSLDDGEEHDFFAYDNIKIEVPEPATTSLFAAGFLGLLALRRRRK